MEPRSKTISNLYIPGEHPSLRFVISISEVNTTPSVSTNTEDMVDSPGIPFGMIDFCTRNSNYLKVIQDFDIVDHTNNECCEMYKSKYGKKHIDLKPNQSAQKSLQI